MTSGHLLCRQIRTEDAWAGLLQTSPPTGWPVGSCPTATSSSPTKLHAGPTLHYHQFRLDWTPASPRTEPVLYNTELPAPFLTTGAAMGSPPAAAQRECGEFHQLWKVVELPAETVCTDRIAHEDTDEIHDSNVYQLLSNLLSPQLSFNNHYHTCP